MSETFDQYLEVTYRENLRFRDLFTNLNLQLSQGYTEDGQEVR